MVAIRKRQQIFGKHHTGMNAYTYLLVVACRYVGNHMEAFRKNQQAFAEHQTGMNAHIHLLEVVVM